MFIKIREILLQRLESSPIKLENNNEVVVTSLIKQIHLLEAEMYMYITQAYPLRSWYVVNEPRPKHGFSRIYKRTLPEICKLFAEHVYSNPGFFLKFHDYESGRDALNRWHFLSFLTPPPLLQTQSFQLLLRFKRIIIHVSLCHFLKNLCFRGFHIQQKTFNLKKIYIFQWSCEKKRPVFVKISTCVHIKLFKTQSKDAAIICNVFRGRPLDSVNACD